MITNNKESIRRKKREKSKKSGKSAPFYWGLVQGIIWLVTAVIGVVLCLVYSGTYYCRFAFIPSFIGIIFIVLGKFACNHKGAAICLVGLSSVLALPFLIVGPPFGLLYSSFALTGGIVGIVKNKKKKSAPAEQLTEEEKKAKADADESSAETLPTALEGTAPTPNKKYKVRLNLGSKSFTIAVVFWVLSLCGFLLIPLSAEILPRYASGFAEKGWFPLFLTGLLLFVLAGDIAHLVFNYLDEKAPRANVRVFWWLTLPPYVCTFSFILMVLAIVGMLYKVLTGNYESKPKGEKVFVVNDNGYERKLKRAEGNEIIDGTLFYRYIDDIGNHWLSADEKTFYKKKFY